MYLLCFIYFEYILIVLYVYKNLLKIIRPYHDSREFEKFRTLFSILRYKINKFGQKCFTVKNFDLTISGI